MVVAGDHELWLQLDCLNKQNNLLTYSIITDNTSIITTGITAPLILYM